MRPSLNRRAAAAGLAIAALLLSACGSDSSTDSDASTSLTPEATPSAPCWTGDGSGSSTPGVIGDVGATPEVTKPDGEPPAEVVSKDLQVGSGAVAAASSTVSVNYHGVNWSDGCVFDSSFARGAAVDFPLDNLIPCWQDGIPGMAEGGRRLLVCPPDSAYGPEGSGHPLAGQTLIFVIDLQKVS